MNPTCPCDFMECSRRDTCRTSDYINCSIHIYYLSHKEIIDEENRVFEEAERRYLIHTIKINGSLRGERL